MNVQQNKCLNLQVILLVLLVILTGCVKKPVENPPQVMSLTDSNFNQLVVNQSGPVLVYFSSTYTVDNLIKTEFLKLFEEHNDQVKFGQYRVDSDNEVKRNVTGLPAVNFYNNGILIDQLATLPHQIPAQQDLIKDIKLWFFETVLSVPGEEKQFTYAFNGGHELEFTPY